MAGPLAMVVGVGLLVLASRAGSAAFRRAGLPRVVGEIVGGLLLGPTVLGVAWPEAHRWLFHGPSAGVLSALSWLGLVLLMFVSGFEIRGEFSREDHRIAGILLLGATTVPFLAGVVAPLAFNFSGYLGPHGNRVSMMIVVGIAVAVTSIPVISKIFLDLGIIDTRFARLVLAVAAVEDICLWVALAVAVGLASAAPPSAAEMVTTPAITVAFSLLALVGLPRVLQALFASPAGSALRRAALPFSLALALVAGGIAQALGINVVFGAFLAGAALGALPGEDLEPAKARIRSAGLGLFAPLYFAIVGLKLDLVHRFDPAFFIGFLLFCTAIKTGATLVAGRVAVRDWRSTFNLAAALNARGGPGIVLATVAFDRGIIDERFFVTLVLIAIVTSLMAGYWFRAVLSRGWELLRVGERPQGRDRAARRLGVTATAADPAA